MAKIAFLGLGQMGTPMATRLLQAGHEVTVWNRTPERHPRSPHPLRDKPGGSRPADRDRRRTRNTAADLGSWLDRQPRRARGLRLQSRCSQLQRR